MKEVQVPKGVKVACGKDFERWYYDENGVPSHSETLECGFAGDICDECKKFNDGNCVEDENEK